MKAMLRLLREKVDTVFMEKPPLFGSYQISSALKVVAR
jgi:hypothetical protein